MYKLYNVDLLVTNENVNKVIIILHILSPGLHSQISTIGMTFQLSFLPDGLN